MRAKTTAVLLATGALISPALAQAHVSIHPNTIPAGAFTTLNLVVPGEQQGAFVKKVDVLLPQGFTSVDYAEVPGWSVHAIERRLAAPVQADGEAIDTEVAQLVWTWTGPLGKVGDGQFAEFPLSVATPDAAAGKPLEFRTVETYSNGQAVHWIDPSLDAEHPAPRINVTAKGGAIEDVAGEEAGPAAGQTAVASGGATDSAIAHGKPAASGGGASKGLALAALIVGALGLLAAIGAWVEARRRGART